MNKSKWMPSGGTLLSLGIVMVAISIVGAVLFDRIPYLRTPTNGGQENISLELADVSAIDLDMEWCDIEIIVGGNRSYLSGSNFARDTVRTGLSNGKLTVRERTENRETGSRINSLLTQNSSDRIGSYLTITLAEGTVLDDLNIDQGAGNLTITLLAADQADISMGLGSLTIRDAGLNALEFEIGMGDAAIERTSVRSKLSGSLGSGDMEIQGRIEGKTSVENGLGSITLELEGSLQDYNIKASSGLGKAFINGFEHDQQATVRNPGAVHSIDAECGTGDIDISIH